MMAGQIIIINKDSSHFGQRGILVDEKIELGNYCFELLMKFRTAQGNQNGRLVNLPDGKNFFFSPREIEEVPARSLRREHVVVSRT